MVACGNQARTLLRALLTPCLFAASVFGPHATAPAAEREFAAAAAPLLEEFCFDCHAGKFPEGDIHLEQMASEPLFAARFKDWEKVAAMLESKKMPPEDMPQPSEKQRSDFASLIRSHLQRAAQQAAGDPGQVIMRRLTSAEYAYSIEDLTGVDLDLEKGFVSDAAGGEGFSNIGTVQFIQDSTLERYLEAAQRVAAHAVIGAGPIAFYPDAGQTGLELSAIHRIQEINRQHGFRTAAGEGGEPFGTERYPQAFYAAWRYRHRKALGLGEATLATLAADEGLNVRFVEHIWSVLREGIPSHPTVEIVTQWRKLPVPGGREVVVGEGGSEQAREKQHSEARGRRRLEDQPGSEGTPRLQETGPQHDLDQQVRDQCEDLYAQLRDWQGRLAESVADPEEASVLTESSIGIDTSHTFRARLRWEEGAEQAQVNLSVVSANPQLAVHPVVVWENPRIRFRKANRRWGEQQPLFAAIDEASTKRIPFEPRATDKEDAAHHDLLNDFVTLGTFSTSLSLPVPEGARQAEVLVDVCLDLERSEDCVVRCGLSGGRNASRSRTISALLGNPAGQAFQAWRAGVAEFARLLPEVSHREPAPSDRDPIPPPFDNAYNSSERNDFHYKIKYHRDDRFLMEKILDDATRRKLDEAWTDLLMSFDYHDTFLRFVADKYQLNLGKRGIGEIEDDWLQRIPAEPRAFVWKLREEHASMRQALLEAEPRHVDDALQFASHAWRRPLTSVEKDRLEGFYHSLRNGPELDHARAVRWLLARILVAPDFLYRVERPGRGSSDVPLSDWELATRLSYFQWSSLPDAELRQAASGGQLHEPQQLAQHAQRMLGHPKSRRMAKEFFGQWFGFYQFDQFRGVDPDRFPEFTQPLKQAMYDEAVAFFEHIVRDDRPPREILFADYVFLNEDLAEHYALRAEDMVEVDDLSPSPRRVELATGSHRGGLLGLGAVLTVTSAPLRTSPVKRGDWVLRRVLGTSVPPPPADAGSIPADDALADGLTVRDRLIAHRREPSCVNCHSRFDAFGFALENYDPLGRWRKTYRGGQPIDTSGELDDGTHISGANGLRRYLEEHEQQFYRTLCGKLLGYALGRGLLASDSQLIERMVQDLQENGATFSNLVMEIVKSRQFRYHRGSGEASGASVADVDVESEAEVNPEIQ